MCIEKILGFLKTVFQGFYIQTASLTVLSLLSIDFAMACMHICGQMKHRFSTLKIYLQLVPILDNSRNSSSNSTLIGSLTTIANTSSLSSSDESAS